MNLLLLGKDLICYAHLNCSAISRASHCVSLLLLFLHVATDKQLMLNGDGSAHICVPSISRRPLYSEAETSA